MMFRPLPLLLALATLAGAMSCDVGDELAAAVTCNIACQDAEACGQNDCEQRCEALAGNEEQLGLCVACLESSDDCQILNNCKTLCSANILDDPTCGAFCGGLQAICDTFDVTACLQTCPTMDDGVRADCVDCYEEQGSTCEAISQCQSCQGTAATPASEEGGGEIVVEGGETSGPDDK